MAEQPALTQQQLAQLEQLKDIRLPEPIGWWPLAPGWWALLVLIVMTLLALLMWWWRRQRSVKKAALAALAMLHSDDPTDFASAVSALLRRVAIQQDGEAVATLSGAEWSAYLQRDQQLSADIADYLAIAPYAPNSEAIASEAIAEPQLRQAAAQWIERNSR